MYDSGILLFSLGICVIFGIILMVYFSPSQVLARAIKEVGKKEYEKLYVIEEAKEYFLIDNGIRVLKRWYNTDSDCYISDYGFYVPIYEQNEINSFILMRK